jgi:hypothetical protein
MGWEPRIEPDEMLSFLLEHWRARIHEAA